MELLLPLAEVTWEGFQEAAFQLDFEEWASVCSPVKWVTEHTGKIKQSRGANVFPPLDQG